MNKLNINIIHATLVVSRQVESRQKSGVADEYIVSSYFFIIAGDDDVVVVLQRLLNGFV